MTNHTQNSRLFVRDVEQDPGWEVRVVDPGDEVAIEPGTWVEMVPADLAWKMHAALTDACEDMKRDPDHILDPNRLRRIGRMDAARCGFEDWAS